MKWIHYGDHAVDPLRRSQTGSYMAVGDKVQPRRLRTIASVKVYGVFAETHKSHQSPDGILQRWYLKRQVAWSKSAKPKLVKPSRKPAAAAQTE